MYKNFPFIIVSLTVALVVMLLVHDRDTRKFQTKCESSGGTMIQDRCLIVKEIK